MTPKKLQQFFHVSNLIEGIDDIEEDERNIRTYREIQKKDDSLSLSMLKFHKSLSHLDNDAIGGQVRTLDNITIGGRRPVPAKEISKSLTMLFKFTPRTFGEIIDWHVAFEDIHPFPDGNGRTGRFLMLLQAERAGVALPYMFFDADDIEQNRQKYYLWFRIRRSKIYTRL